MKAAGNLQSLDHLVKKALHAVIAESQLIVVTLQEEIDVVQSQFNCAPLPAELWCHNRRRGGGSDSSGCCFVDGNVHLPHDEHMQRRKNLGVGSGNEHHSIQSLLRRII